MLTVLRRIIRRAPLLTLILFIWFVLTVMSLIGRGRAYKNYDTDHGRLPGLSIVMRGLHDHVLPWSKKPGGQSPGNRDERAEVSEGTDGKQADAGAPDTDKETEKPQDTAVADKNGTDQSEQQGTETVEKDTGGDNGDALKEEKGGQKTGAEEAPDDAKTETKPLKVPDTSCSKVVGAKDYGVANKTYLSPEDTVYNTDKEGLFAPNGTYYALQEVDDSYFSDALLIGDSRTVGLYEYGEMENVTSFLARESTTIYDLFDDDEKMEYTPKGKESRERTLKDLLSKAKFKKIYISVGVNELGIPDTKDYYEEFRKVIKKINKLQPDAIIYIQGIMHVSRNMSSTDPVYNNKAIVQRNKAISTLANGRNIFYIDMNADLCDENGDLKAELTGDGIHLKASACELWHKFLKKNAIVIPAPAPEEEAPAGES